MKFFDGLYSYELVLLVLGVILFLVTLYLLISLVLRQRPFGSLLGFFVIPIVMIGYPSVKSFQFGQAVVTLKSDVSEYANHPTKSLRDKLAIEVGQLSLRPSSNPATITAIARAQVALGNTEAANAYVNKALTHLPNNAQVLQLHKQLERASPQNKN